MLPTNALRFGQTPYAFSLNASRAVLLNACSRLDSYGLSAVAVLTRNAWRINA